MPCKGKSAQGVGLGWRNVRMRAVGEGKDVIDLKGKTGLLVQIKKAIARALLKQPKILIFDEATSSLDQATAQHFAVTLNPIKGKVSMLFITALPKNLQVDEVVRIGRGTLGAVSETHGSRP